MNSNKNECGFNLDSNIRLELAQYAGSMKCAGKPYKNLSYAVQNMIDLIKPRNTPPADLTDTSDEEDPLDQTRKKYRKKKCKA